MKYLLLLLLVGIGSAANGATVVMDFEGIVEDEEVLNVSVLLPGPPYIYQEDGLQLTVGSSQAAFRGKSAQPGIDFDSDYFDWCVAPDGVCNTQSVSLSTVSGQAFDLLSMDMTAVIEGGDVVLTGFLQGGGTVSLTHTLLVGNIELVTFDSSWSNLTSVSFTAGAFTGFGFGMGIDDVTASVVPIPAAVWLFGSALAGLGWIRRKQTV